MVVDCFPVYDGVIFSSWEEMAEALEQIVSRKAGMMNAALIETELALAYFAFDQHRDVEIDSLVVGQLLVKQLEEGVWVRNTPPSGTEPILVFDEGQRLAPTRFAVSFDAGERRFSSLSLERVAQFLGGPASGLGKSFSIGTLGELSLIAEAKWPVEWEIAGNILSFDPVSWVEISIARSGGLPLNQGAANHIQWIAVSQMAHVELLD